MSGKYKKKTKTIFKKSRLIYKEDLLENNRHKKNNKR